MTERLGLGPDVACARNPRLVYGRMTGWGQDGPLAHAAGHDINYIALTGALDAIGRAGEPAGAAAEPGRRLRRRRHVAGVRGAVRRCSRRKRSGQGQVVDAAMVDGAALLMALFYAMTGARPWRDERGANLLDGGAPFYDIYECADGRVLSVGRDRAAVLRPVLCERSASMRRGFPDRMSPAAWPAMKAELTAVFRPAPGTTGPRLRRHRRLRAPILDMDEAPSHPHNAARGTFLNRDGVVHPAPPRASAAPPPRPARPPRCAGAHRGGAGGVRLLRRRPRRAAQRQRHLREQNAMDTSPGQPGRSLSGPRTVYNADHEMFRDQVRRFFDRTSCRITGNGNTTASCRAACG